MQVVWFAVQHLIFVKWWLPARLRPPMLRLFGAQVGDRVLVRHGVRVLWPWKLTIGNDVWIGEGAWLYSMEDIRIGRDVCVSQEAFLCTGSHDPRDATFPYKNAPIVLEDGTWIAAQVLVLPGAVVPSGTVVPARDRVTRDTFLPREPGEQGSAP